MNRAEIMQAEELIKLALEEDLGDGDHTSLSTIPRDAKGQARLFIKEKGIIAGIEIAIMVFQQLDKNIRIKKFLKDGAAVNPGDIGFVVEGKVHSILSGERLALNYLQRMSGIASFTHQVAQKLKGLNTKILDTRKTTPNMRYFEKEAVRIGGGYNHRMGLYDMIMIKDNHIDFAGGIEAAVNSVKKYLNKNKKNLKVEIEVRSFEELHEVLAIGQIDRIMLDNFELEDLRKAVEIIDKRFETEASGGISIDNARAYAETGVDFISMGALTHQIKSLDMSLKAIHY
ncbi:MAG: carboxylating nicotinate-nucleotide diphosphorylase [Bacteroidales bacterium]|nr:carboxylating nicotinate-nucleotide diphosphorylase [Bacteroidales bacterium]MCF8386379.1 carboxylating nicotinate-nucleotide diphosphorylase [Bacteroidales bacterium]MCF8396779.1 carboxylating nicotinate-nucleotide diphosphorylase [Bacteroidales bacterium]